MHWIDITIFIVYMVAMLGIGLFFYYRNKSHEDFLVGGRKMGSLHIGLSVVATDVGGGFSIGLGGLGFVMGISGSWMLFTGLVGAWLSAVLLIPRVYKLAERKNMISFPQVIRHYYGARIAMLAAIISAVGYLGFTSSQILAGAKLASASFSAINLNQALLIMGVIALVYTVLGGLKAVIYTDTVQWIILMLGLTLVGIPVSLKQIGGMEAIFEMLPKEFYSLNNVGLKTLANWTITILPIWFIGMTLYQRIYATRSEIKAKRAWFVAGLFEYPVMAFLGVFLGLISRVAFLQGHFADMGHVDLASFDPELGLPLLLRTHLPIGLMGIMLSAYFSAIMSTADSCLIAASGNIFADIMRFQNSKNRLLKSQIVTLIAGIIALIIAYSLPAVLDMMLHSYAVMVSGLLVPTVGALFFSNKNSMAAFWAMILGGGGTLLLINMKTALPFDLDPIFYGLSLSFLAFIGITFFTSIKYLAR